MSYYYGQAKIPVGNLRIRVEPENLDGNIVTELEIKLYAAKSRGSGQTQKTFRWQKRHNSQGRPRIFAMWVQIGSEKRGLKFKGEVPGD